MPGSNNDLNVLAHSPLFDNMLKGVAPPCNYIINGHRYNMGYFLTDGIYPKLTIIVQAFIQTLDILDYVRFNNYQMAKRKDVERAFRVLQGKFRIFGSPCKYWQQFDLNLIMKCCLILHNMIIEHEHRDMGWGRVVPVPILEPTDNGRVFMSSLKNLKMHLQLRTDLVAYIVARPGRGARTADSSSFEGSDMEYVVLPSSDGEYDDTDLEEEVVTAQNEDCEHVYGDGHAEEECEHDGDDDDDEDEYDDDDEDEDDDDEEDEGDE
ncbi:zinc finger CCCH domain-containing protein 15 homolog [Papaver somniferum]|uniref:zinc finger CCCH domain-containing protein 15 homolog n=1 Tax=Papaver somniferum TaxID=3469 RepID=UPI000E702738|nr:zinc finger CCCH domain-containing protein 15 homolog [Papaver somniferum]